MNRFLLLLTALFLFTALRAQGIKFEDGLSWSDIQAKARTENKYIFMDCQTSWCGWCRRMEKDVFPDSALGAFVNSDFIPVSVQFDQTAKDDENTKKWYNDAKEIAKAYPISGYPTFLIFAPDGQIVQRLVGYQPAPDFLSALKRSLNKDYQYYTLLHQYEAGERSHEFLRRFIEAAGIADDPQVASKAFQEYYGQIKDPYTKENLLFIIENTGSVKDKSFKLFLNNATKVDEVLGSGTAEKKVHSIAETEMTDKYRRNRNIDLDSLGDSFKSLVPGIDLSREVLSLKVDKASYNKDWTSFRNYAIAYMDNGEEGKQDASELNNFAWMFLKHYSDLPTLQIACDWSRKSVELSKGLDPGINYNYAVLLYKCGKKQESLIWVKKAVNEATDTKTKNAFQEAYDKMIKGEEV